MYSSASISRIALYNEKAIFVGADKKIITNPYNNTCVNDISVGFDGSIWALQCNNSGEVDTNVIKWNPFA